MSAHINRAWLKAMNSGFSAFQKRQLKTAYNYFNKATQSAPEKPEGWINLAETTNQLGRYAEAIHYAKRALSIHGNLHQAHQVLGDALLEIGDFSNALPHFQKALQINVNAGSLYRMSRCLTLLGRCQEAESLLNKAISIDPNLVASHCLLATIKLILGNPGEALKAIEHCPKKLSNDDESYEIQSIQELAREYERCQSSIEEFLVSPTRNDLDKLTRNCFSIELSRDDLTLNRLRAYAQTLQAANPNVRVLESLPDLWNEYEAFFMIPLVESFEEYSKIRESVFRGMDDNKEYLETINMIQAICHARTRAYDLSSPDSAEAILREVHALACEKLSDYHAGQFKFFQNNVGYQSIIERTPPCSVMGTLSTFFDDIYPIANDGLGKAILILMAILDIHPFVDGNGRVAITLFNRELEKSGLLPALFTKSLGVAGELGEAINSFRRAPSSYPESIYNVIEKAQETTAEFIDQLKNNSKLDAEEYSAE